VFNSFNSDVKLLKEINLREELGYSDARELKVTDSRWSQDGKIYISTTTGLLIRLDVSDINEIKVETVFETPFDAINQFEL